MLLQHDNMDVDWDKHKSISCQTLFSKLKKQEEKYMNNFFWNLNPPPIQIQRPFGCELSHPKLYQPANQLCVFQAVNTDSTVPTAES